MKQFFKKTSLVFFLFAGLFTAIGGSIAFIPKIGLESLFKMDYVPNYTIILHHWGMTLLLLGIFIIISAFKVEWRIPILLIAIFGKLYIAILYLIYINSPFACNFAITALVDFIISAYFILYLIYHKKIYQA